MPTFEYAPAPESRAVVDLQSSYGLFINGEFVDGRGTSFKSISPATEEVLTEGVQALVERRMQEEFKDVHLITAWGHDAGVIHSRREVRRMEDMTGLKLRFPTRQTGEALKALGAAPVGMPVPQVPEPQWVWACHLAPLSARQARPEVGR